MNGTVVISGLAICDIFGDKKYKLKVKDNSHITIENKKSVDVYDESRVICYGDSFVKAHDKSIVTLYDNSCAKLYNNSYGTAYENSKVDAYNNSVVKAQRNSSVNSFHDATVFSMSQSTVTGYNNSTIIAKVDSIVKSFDNVNIFAYGWSNVKSFNNSKVKAYDNVSIKAFDNSEVEAYGNSVVRVEYDIKKLSLHGYSVLFMPYNSNFKFTKGRKCKVVKYKQEKFIERNGVKKVKGSIILYKRVSKDFLTQERTLNETLWKIGSIVTHPNWNPTFRECGEGKFHACSKPFECDEFRYDDDDKYIAIKVKIADLYEWNNNPAYPKKIAFRKGKVLYEVDNLGNSI